jgi:hypothetical protein
MTDSRSYPASESAAPDANFLIGTLQTMSGTEEADINFLLGKLGLSRTGPAREDIASFRRQMIITAAHEAGLSAGGAGETWVTHNPDGSISLDAYAGWSRDQLKDRCRELCMAMEDWQFTAMSAATDGANSLQNVREPYRSKIAERIEAYSDDEPETPHPATVAQGAVGCDVTDAMCEAAIEAEDAVVDRIQGFSYNTRHVIRDVRMPWSEQEIWSAPVAGPDEYQTFQRRCQIERMRRVLAAALAVTSTKLGGGA